MPRLNVRIRWPRRSVLAPHSYAIALCIFTLGIAPRVAAFEIETGIADFKASWDTTVKYSGAVRTEARSPVLTDRRPATLNQDDGDNNFDRGLVSNRIDIFTEADVTYRDFGARLSAAGWYDWVYNHTNDNNSPGTVNQYTVPFNDFTRATRRVHGREFELLDAFVFGKGTVGAVQGSFRVGRHALLWGESLFFGANGIAGAQAPVDVVKVVAVPNSQFKEIILPVGQVSGQLQLTPTVSIAGYYQYEWTQSRLPAVGSYFSTGDILDFGGERILAGAPLVPRGPPAAFYRDVDRWARNSGQGGIALRVHMFDSDFGLYALRWHSKSPQIYIQPAVLPSPAGPPVIVDPANFDPPSGRIGRYFLAYPEDINTVGASASMTVGDFNFAGEFSVRHNSPLVSDAQAIGPGVVADNRRHPLYAVGNSAHSQASMLWTMPPSFVAREATLVAEVAWNRRTAITKNPAALDPNTSRDATSARMIVEPTYRQVLAGVDITVPLGASYTRGRSSAVAAFGVDKGGDVNIGVTAAYLDRWRFALTYTHFYGPAGTVTDNVNHFTFAQALADRDFVTFTARTTF